MNKRKRILIASIALIAVTAASTLAYFTSQATIGNTGVGNTLQLDIKNGQVSITAQPGGSESISNWSYDVARLSTTDYALLTDGSSSPTVVAGITDTGVPATDILNYENKHRSIDMIGLGAVSTENAAGTTADTNGKKNSVDWAANVNSYYRWKIGAPVIGAIKYARPGDAFVMGQAAAYGDGTAAPNAGLVIKNTSNLTVKVNVTAAGNAADTFTALSNAGWVFYVGKQGGPINQYTDSATFITAVNNILKSETWEQNHVLTLNIRLELPVLTDNGKKDLSVSQNAVTSFDLNNLFTITATQENNPGWKTDGSN